MNWKNVLYLLRVERKSGRLLRGVKTTKYREHGIIAYWPYWVAAIIGILGGYLANLATAAIYSDATAAAVLPPLSAAVISFFVSLPTLILILSVVLTMLQQIQLAGIKATRQVNYWLPITWQEHTLASILANLLGIPIATVIAFASGIIVFAALNGGLIVSALLTSLALFGAAFLASSTTEIVRVLQVRFTGAVYKSSGKAAVWVRFVGTLIFFLVFYIVYFMITQGTTQFIQGLATAQNTVWFIPFVWLGVTLFYLLNGILLNGVIFVALSIVFIAALYYLAIALNRRFGLYEPPAITVQTRGTIYAPKSGLLGKLGFSSVEAAIIRKDIRSFTRRRELISVFIVPIVFILVPIMQSLNLTNSGAPPEINFFFMAMVFLVPSAFMSMILGNMLIGEEGQAVWRIYASPISPKNLVKSKFFFQIIFSIIILVVSGIVGAILFQPSLRFIIVSFIEDIFLILSLGAIALTMGFKGADFTVSRRARMIRQRWSLISLIICFVAGIGMLAPFFPYIIGMFLPGFILAVPSSNLNLGISIVISGIIASVITAIFYKVNIGSAEELLRKAEV